MTERKDKLLTIIAVKKHLQSNHAIMDAFLKSNGILLKWNHLNKRYFLLKEQYLSLMMIAADLKTQERLYWTKKRTQSFWEVDCQENSEEFFKSNFRMSRSSFLELCDHVRLLTKRDTPLRKAIPLEKRVAIALFALGSSTEYRTVANMFGVGKSTVHNILLEFCKEVWKALRPKYFSSFPLTREKLNELTNGFETLGFPQCMGAIDVCHIEIHPSSEDAIDYCNDRGWYSSVLLALVDVRCNFTYINVGSPGRCNDSEIFESSSLKKELDKCPLLREMHKKISGVNVPICLIGDSAFPFTEHIMKPYPVCKTQSRKEMRFNKFLCKSRSVAENAFNQLKARFCRIGKGIDNNIANSNVIIKACCALHNFLNDKNETLNESWLTELRGIEINRSYPKRDCCIEDHLNKPERIRNALASFFTLDVNGD